MRILILYFSFPWGSPGPLLFKASVIRVLAISSAQPDPDHHGHFIQFIVALITLQFEYWCYWLALDTMQVL